MSVTYEEWCLDRDLDPDDWEVYEEFCYEGSEAARLDAEERRVDERILRKHGVE